MLQNRGKENGLQIEFKCSGLWLWFIMIWFGRTKPLFACWENSKHEINVVSNSVFPIILGVVKILFDLMRKKFGCWDNWGKNLLYNMFCGPFCLNPLCFAFKFLPSISSSFFSFNVLSHSLVQSLTNWKFNSVSYVYFLGNDMEWKENFCWFLVYVQIWHIFSKLMYNLYFMHQI